MKLLLEMNLSPRWVRVLVDAGFEVVHWSAVGAADAPDSEIMSYASREGAMVVKAELKSGALLTVEPGRTRMRVLPLTRT